MWTGEVGSFKGKHYRLEETLNSSQALSEPHPPIMVGGRGGEKKILRLVARYVDACNLFAYGGKEMLRHKLDILKGHCEDVGRDYDEIEKATLGTAHLAPGQMSAEDVIGMCREQSEVGVQHAIFNMSNVHDIEPLERFGEEIIPAVAEL